MNKTAKIVLIILALALIAFVAYRATSSRKAVGTPSPDQVIWRGYDDPLKRYAIDQPQGFDPLPSIDGKTVSFRNASITRNGEPAFVAVSLMDNPDGLALQAWFDQQIAGGILPAASSTKITRDGRLGGKEVIVVRPEGFSSATYFFAAGDRQVAVMRELLADEYMDRFIRSFSLKQ